MGYPRPTEPDRFLPYTNKPPQLGLTTADIGQSTLQNLRACAVASGLPQEVIDRLVRYGKKAGLTLSIAWSTGANDTAAATLRNFGWLFTRVGVHKDKASAFVRTFPLLGGGTGGTIITGLTNIPATFKAPV